MIKTIIIALISMALSGCSSVGTYQTWEDSTWVNEERYICKGVGCDVDFKEQRMKGGTFIPEIPLKVNQ